MAFDNFWPLKLVWGRREFFSIAHTPFNKRNKTNHFNEKQLTLGAKVEVLDVCVCMWVSDKVYIWVWTFIHTGEEKVKQPLSLDCIIMWNLVLFFSFNITLEMRTLYKTGLILYITNEAQSEFVALQMSDGRIVVSYDDRGITRDIDSDGNLNDGNWHKVCTTHP